MRILVAAAWLTLATDAVAQVPGLTGTIVVTNKQPATATIVDVASGRTLATLPTGQGPHEVVISADGRTAVVTDYGAQTPGRTLTVVDVPALRVARTIDLGEYTRPHGIAWMPGDSVVVVTSETTRNIVLVNVRTGSVVRAIPTQGNGSHMVGVTANGALAFTGNMGTHNVSQIDLGTGAVVRQFAVPNTPEAINVTPDGREVWVGSNATGRVSVVDPATGAVTTAAEGLAWPYRVLFSPDAGLALLPDYRGEALRFLDRATKRELGRLAFPGAGPQGITITPDGRFALQSLAAFGRVAVVDVGTRASVGTLAVGDTPDGVAFTTRVVAPPAPQARPEDVATVDAAP